MDHGSLFYCPGGLVLMGNTAKHPLPVTETESDLECHPPLNLVRVKLSAERGVT